VALAAAYLRAKWHPNPSNHLATIYQHHRQTGQTRQSDNGLVAQGEPFYKWSPNKNKLKFKSLKVEKSYTTVNNRLYQCISYSFEFGTSSRSCRSISFFQVYAGSLLCSAIQNTRKRTFKVASPSHPCHSLTALSMTLCCSRSNTSIRCCFSLLTSTTVF